MIANTYPLSLFFIIENKPITESKEPIILGSGLIIKTNEIIDIHIPTIEMTEFFFIRFGFIRLCFNFRDNITTIRANDSLCRNFLIAFWAIH